MKKLSAIILVLILFAFFACKKPAGEGGTASITGKIIMQNIHNKNKAASIEDICVNENVYIAYGDKPIYDNDYKTSYDGSFIFKYLRKGTYTIFVYSLDSTQSFSVGKPVSKIAIVKKVVIDNANKKSTIDIGNITILKEANDGGSSQIKGKVFAKYYNKDFSSFQGSGYAGDIDVMINYGDAPVADRVKSAYDGSFEFNYLHKGNYTVFVYSKDSLQLAPSGNVPVVKNVTITSNKQIIDLGKINIFD